MYKLWPLVILLLPGCTFLSFDKDGINPRSQPNAHPGLYIILAVFCLILVMSVGTALFKQSKPDPRGDESKAFAAMIAFLATVVVLLLTA